MDEFKFRPSFIDLPAVSSFEGSVTLPGSKSITNRIFLIAALARGTTQLHNLLKSDDTRYMGQALKTLGVEIDFFDDCSEAVVVGKAGSINNSDKGIPFDLYPEKPVELFLGNAGTAMRSLCAALTLGKGSVILRGEERMKERPIRDLVDALCSIGADISYEESEGYPPVAINARGLRGGDVEVKGNISSQYLTALLICAPYCREPLNIHVNGELISKPYVELTLDVMKSFGIEVEHKDMTDFYVPCGVYDSPGEFTVEGDASSASYPLAAAAISGGKLRVIGVGKKSRQGDVAFANVLAQMGARITWGDDFIECEGVPGKLHSLGAFNAVNIPDAAMTVAVLALFADAPMTIEGIASWRVKETDRIAAMAAELRKVGAEVRETMDSITVYPPAEFKAATIETYNDHRMAMCFSLVSLCGVPIRIMDPACVNKTYPNFFDDFKRLSR